MQNQLDKSFIGIFNETNVSAFNLTSFSYRRSGTDEFGFWLNIFLPLVLVFATFYTATKIIKVSYPSVKALDVVRKFIDCNLGCCHRARKSAERIYANNGTIKHTALAVMANQLVFHTNCCLHTRHDFLMRQNNRRASNIPVQQLFPYLAFLRFLHHRCYHFLFPYQCHFQEIFNSW